MRRLPSKERGGTSVTWQLLFPGNIGKWRRYRHISHNAAIAVDHSVTHPLAGCRISKTYLSHYGTLHMN